MLVKVISLLILIALCVLPAPGLAYDVSGKWCSSYLGHRLTAQVDQSGNTIRGVAYVYGLFGKRDTYHFTGTIQGRRVIARHHQGHTFKGELVAPGKGVGTVITRYGHRLRVEGSRVATSGGS